MATRDEAVRALLIASVAALIGIGAIMIYSTTARGDGALVTPPFLRQMFYTVIGAGAAFAVACVDYRILLRHSKLLLGIAIVLLALVLIPGVGSRINGASRWLRIGPLGLGFQPSELAKLALIVFLAAFLAERKDALGSFRKGLLPAVAAVGVVCMLILPEPDIGTTALVAAVAWVVLFIAGAKLIVSLCAGAAGRAGGVQDSHERLRSRANRRLARPVEGPGRDRLPHHPVAHRGRLRRRLGRGPRGVEAEALLPAGVVDATSSSRYSRRSWALSA